MKKQVSPVLAVVLILVALGAIQVAYWIGLVGRGGELTAKPPGGGAGGPEGGAAPPPVGSARCVVATVAGAPDPGDADGAAKVARFNGPAAVVIGANGAMYVADSRNHVIRRIAANGAVTTFAGRLETGFGGFADGPAGQARFSAPAGIAALPGGGLLVADTGNHRIRKIAPDGTVSTLAGAQTPLDDLGRPAGGYRDGAAGEAQFKYPVGLAVDGGGTVYIADAGNHRVRRLANGAVTTIPTAGPGQLDTPTQVALAGGQLWVTDAAKSAVWVGPPGGPLRRQTLTFDGKPLGAVSGVAAGGGGMLLLDAKTDCLYMLAGGKLSLLAGQFRQPDCLDGPGDQARFAEPAGLTVAPDGTIYVADFGNNCIRKVTAGHQEGR